MQAALQDIINKDLQVLASDMQVWVVQSFDEVTPPTSVADFPPPVIPEFGNVRSLARNGVLQFMKTSSGGTSGGNSIDARGESGDYGRGGTRRTQPSKLFSGKRSRPFGVCWKFLEGKCQYTAEECAFTHRRADHDGGSAGGSVDGASRWGNSGGGGSGSGGGSSAIVVRRGRSSSAVARRGGSSSANE